LQTPHPRHDRERRNAQTHAALSKQARQASTYSSIAALHPHIRPAHTHTHMRNPSILHRFKTPHSAHQRVYVVQLKAMHAMQYTNSCINSASLSPSLSVRGVCVCVDPRHRSIVHHTLKMTEQIPRQPASDTCGTAGRFGVCHVTSAWARTCTWACGSWGCWPQCRRQSRLPR